MSLREDVKDLLDVYKQKSSDLEYKCKLFEAYEGDLLPQILADLAKQLSPNSYETVKHRVAPINVLQRIIDKLSKIYDIPPTRTIVDGKKKEQKALGELIRLTQFNTKMSAANEFFNLFKNVWIEPYLDNGKPEVRSIPSDRFFVWSNDPVDPTRPTHFVKIMGKDKDAKVIFYAYTKDEFLIFDSEGNARSDLMAKAENDGENAYGVLPGVYINRSLYSLMPRPDTDVLALTKLIPVILSDCNFAIMFQAFSIMYGIDVNDQNLKMAPNVFWSFKTDPSKETKPEVGILKPDVDVEKVFSYTQGLLALWLETKGIKPGSIGSLSTANAASGFAKMIDESDTTADRKKQVTYFAPKDGQVLELMLNKMLPVWRESGQLTSDIPLTSDDYRITSTFPEQNPMVDEKSETDVQTSQLSAGLTTKKRALKKLNPDMTDEEIETLMTEIDVEQKDKVKANPPGKDIQNPPKGA